jgi:hypothetical protein
MTSAVAQVGSEWLETRVVAIAFWLSGIVIGVAAVSYVLYSPFPIEVLVWVVGAVFAGLALLSFEWPWAFRSLPREVPEGGRQAFLLLSIPAGYILAPVLCGPGLKTCTPLGVALGLSLMGLAWVTALRLYEGESVGHLLVPMAVLSLVPHCVCPAPTNMVLRSVFGGYAPNSFVLPLVTTLFAVAGSRGVRTRWSTRLVAVLLAVNIAVLVGSHFLGFPWEAHA